MLKLDHWLPPSGDMGNVGSFSPIPVEYEKMVEILFFS